jgi:hypothetical protein
MDPFLESQIWDDFHQEFIGGIRQFLLPMIEPQYYARIEQRVYIDRGMSDEPRSILADVGIASVEESTQSAAVANSAAVAESVVIDLVIPEEHRESFLTIIESSTKEIITIIEVLSPSNKRRGSDGREQYLSKRAASAPQSSILRSISSSSICSGAALDFPRHLRSRQRTTMHSFAALPSVTRLLSCSGAWLTRSLQFWFH